MQKLDNKAESACELDFANLAIRYVSSIVAVKEPTEAQTLLFKNIFWKTDTIKLFLMGLLI